MEKRILVEIGPDGVTKVEALGYEGRGCVEATEAIEKLIGKVVSDQKKPEFNRRQVASERKTQGR